MATFEYLESFDDNAGDSLQNFGFSHDAGGANGVYQLDIDEPSDSADLQAVLTDILGFTYTGGSGTQKLHRDLPATHPAFPYLYATQITAIHGTGVKDAARVPEVVPPITGNPEAICDTFYLYPKYKISTTFATRPYTVLPDEQVELLEGSWYPDGYLSTDSPETFTYASEWVRYTDYSIVPQNNNIQGQTGAMSFKDLCGALRQFTSPPFMYLPDSILTLTWYQVPYRYITSENSYIANKGWKGRINQNDWYLWPAGSLLYLNYDVKKYQQPSLETEALSDLNDNIWDSYSKLCDITFMFLLTNRTTPTTPSTPYYGNWIAAGHNLQPYLPTREFYYATATNKKNPDCSNVSPPEAGYAPLWNSAPFELLFSDPDAAGGV